jgi:osmotically-inducible protein OsmY
VTAVRRAAARRLAIRPVAGLVAACLAAASLVMSGCSKEQVKNAMPPAVPAVQPGGLADQAMATTIRMSLRSDPRTQSSNINVNVTGRAVTLSGTAATAAAKAAAVEIAGKSAGAAEVTDQMTVAPGGP